MNDNGNPSSTYSTRKVCHLKTGEVLLRCSFAILFLIAATSSMFGQMIRFRSGQVRVTVPINSTNSTIITNQVNLTGVTNASFDISGLPTGAAALLTDTNSTPVVTVTTD